MYKQEIATKIAELFPLYPSIDFDYAHENPHSPWRVGMHSEYSPLLKRKLIAALISEMLQCSVQTALKKIPENIDYGMHPRRIDKDVTQFCMVELQELADYISAPQGGKLEGEFAAGLAFSRVPHSFRCLLTSANRGYLYESMAIARHLLELVGWVYAVRPLATISDAEKIAPQKSIGVLSCFYPKAGKLYGYLSEHSHFMPHKHEQHICVIDEKVGTISQSVLYKGYALTLAIILMDVICALRDFYYCSNLKMSAYLLNRTPLKLRARRPTRAFLIDLKKSWPKEDETFEAIFGLIA